MVGNIHIFADSFFQEATSEHTDLFFFWALHQILNMLDEEDSPAVNSNSNTFNYGSGEEFQHNRREQWWVKRGLVEMLESYSSSYRGRCGIVELSKRNELDGFECIVKIRKTVC